MTDVEYGVRYHPGPSGSSEDGWFVMSYREQSLPNSELRVAPVKDVSKQQVGCVPRYNMHPTCLYVSNMCIHTKYARTLTRAAYQLGGTCKRGHLSTALSVASYIQANILSLYYARHHGGLCQAVQRCMPHTMMITLLSKA